MATRDLRNASRAEVEEHFDSWVRGGDAIIAGFRQRLDGAGGPVAALGAGVEGLPTLFAWVVDRVRFVDVVPDDDLPLWCLPGPAADERGALDPASAHLADGLARHYGEVLVRELPGLRWQIGDEPRRRKQYFDQNWPVVVGPLLAVNPISAVALVVREAETDPGARRVDWLRTNAERYAEILARGGPLDTEPSYWVDEVDDVGVREEGWRLEVGIDDDITTAAGAALTTLTDTLASLPHVVSVEHAERGSWLVAGDPDPDRLLAAVRGWVARH